MLSIENPPDPSCSSKFRGSKNHGTGSEKLPLQEPDLASSSLDETKLPKFSIRDYVVSARTKDIQKNWPFQQQFLKICLKHGVKDLLPPFEPPDSVRTRCYVKKVGSDQPVACVNGKKGVTATDLFEEERVCSSDKGTVNTKDRSLDRFEFLLSDVRNRRSIVGDEINEEKPSKSSDLIEDTVFREAEIASTVTSNGWIDGKSPQTYSIAEESIAQSEKKSNLIDNLEFVSESSRTEEIVSNSSTISDPMASNICPVCKAFTSTSNTTLNAHMDQCLKVESTSKRIGTHQIKHRVKPRKKRSMVDICATARRCTLQDLDRMNGTNWAENLSCLDSKCNFESDRESKRQRNNIGDSDGSAVYVDSNGTKVRILSKFDEDLEPRRREEIKQRKHLKESSVEKNKRRFAPNGCKEVKAKPYNKKLGSLKLHKDEIHEALEGTSHTDNKGWKEKYLSQLQRAREQLSPTTSGTLRQWVCSKRSILPKQSDNNGQKDVGSLKQNTEHIKGNRFEEGTSHGAENHVPKFLKSSQNSDSLLSFKTLDSHSNQDPKPDNGRKISPKPPKNNCNPLMEGTSMSDGCILRFPRPSGNYVSSPRSKRVEIHLSTVQNANNVPKTAPELPDEKHYLPAEPNKVSNVVKSTLFSGSDFHRKKKKCNKNNGSSILQKPQRHVLRLKSCEWVGEMPHETVKERDFVHGFNDIFRPKSMSLSKKGTRKLGLPKTLARSERKERVCERNIDRGNLLKTRQEPEARSLSGRLKSSVLKQLKSSAERSSLDPITIASGAKELAGNIDMVLASSAGKNVMDRVIRSSKTDSSKAHSQIDQCHAKNHGQLVHGIKAQVEFGVPSLSSNQETNGPEEFSNGISGVNDQNEAETDVRLEGNCLYGICEFDANSTPKQGLEGNCPAQVDVGFEVLHEDSSITNRGDSPQSTTSVQLQFANDQHKLVHRDTLGSPRLLSLGSSALSLDGKSNREDSAQLISDRKFPCRAIITDHESFGVKSTAPGKEAVELQDNRICNGRKDIFTRETVPTYRELQLATQRTAAEMQQKSGGWQDRRRDEMVMSALESHIDVVSSKEQLASVLKFPTLAAQNSATLLPAHSQAPPSPNPILRLMGKNLMVASKDEEEPDQLNGFSNGAANNHPNTKYLALLGFSSNNGSNKDGFSFNREGSLIFGQDSCNLAQNCAAGTPKNFGNHSNCKIYQAPSCHCAICMGDFTASNPGLNGKTSAEAQQKKLNRKLNSSFAFNIEGTVKTPYQQDQLPISSTHGTNSVQEVIVIDDSPEFEDDSSTVYTDYTGSGTNPSSPIGISSPAISNSNLKQAKPFSCFPLQSGFSYRDHQPTGLGPNFFMPCPGANMNSAKRGNNSGGSGVLLPNTSVLPQVSTVCLNPTLYYSQRLL